MRDSSACENGPVLDIRDVHKQIRRAEQTRGLLASTVPERAGGLSTTGTGSVHWVPGDSATAGHRWAAWLSTY